MIEAILAGFLASFVVTFLIMPGIIRTMKAHGMTGPNHETPKPSD